MIDVSVIIVNYNTCRLTLQCLDSVFKNTKDISFEVIVVDNASCDDSVPCIREQFPQVKLVLSNLNLGFGKANNLGAEIAKGTYLFLLNSDTILLNNAIKIFFYSMQQMPPDIACIGCQLLDPNLKPTHSFGNFPTIRSTLKDALLVIMPIFRRYKKEKEISGYPFIVNYITGADLFLRKAISDRHGLFDPDFFMYYEETEMQYRFRKYGYKSMIINTPSIIHLEGASGNKYKRNYRTKYFLTEGCFWYFRKTENRVNYFIFRTLFAMLRLPSVLLKNVSLESKCEYIRLLFRKF